MNSVIRKFFQLLTNKNTAAILLLTSVLLLTICIHTAYSILSYDKIYSGVYINTIYTGNLTPDEAKKAVESNIRDSYLKQFIELRCKGFSTRFRIGDVETKYSVDEAVQNAFSVGREGNVFSRLLSITSAKRYGKAVHFPVTYNKEAVREKVNDLYNKIFKPVKENDYIIDDVKVTVVSGVNGESFDREDVLKKIESFISFGTGGFINIPIITTNPSKINIDTLYDKVYTEAKDASLSIQNNEVIIIPHVIGKRIDKSLGAEILSSLEKEAGAIRTIPIIVTNPKVFEEDLKSKLFADTLYSSSTSFSTANVNRTNNIKLASAKINGKILAPGEIFSYNEVVGPRTAALGYKGANTYVGGKIVEGIGGGICQVSSTLYNSLLFSGLEILERTNHQMTVSYIPLGHDAAVDYNGVDLKFRNSTSWPIKIIATVSGGTLTVAIKGTNEHPGRKIETRTNTIKTINFTEQVTYDPSLPEGTRVVTTEGMKGFIVEVYKIIKQDNNIVSETLLSKNHYLPLKQEVRVGTKKVEPSQPPAPPAPQPPPATEVEPPPAEVN